jgi:hypothetical protein
MVDMAGRADSRKAADQGPHGIALREMAQFLFVICVAEP